jgi:hypothetical protein
MKSSRQGMVVSVLLASMCAGPTALAWNAQGHQVVGAIADALLAGTHAGSEVNQILGSGETLQTAALWADCAKGVVKNKKTGLFHFAVSPRFPECIPFQTTAGKKEMVSFVKRNWDACHPAADEEACHKQYHYADVAIERNGYARSEVGTSDHDVVSAINAAVAVLRGGAAPAPFDLADKKEALRVLAHYVGDVHQPLHVGAIYLSSAGQEEDPDTGPFDPATKTQGGNLIKNGSSGLHHEWDTIPVNLEVASFLSNGVAAARLVPISTGAAGTWAAQWASDTVMASHTAFQGLSFGAEVDPGKKQEHWPVTEPADYATARAAVQKTQLVKAGARLAQLLKAVWPLRDYQRQNSAGRAGVLTSLGQHPAGDLELVG